MELRVHRRWVHWGFAIAVGALMLLFGAMIVATLLRPAQLGEGIRILIPPYLVILYPALAVMANYKTALVRPDGVTIWVRPFPTKSSVYVDRGDIHLAYARTRASYEDGQEIGREYSAGVETRQGLQFDVTGPQPSMEAALERAGVIAGILNASPTHHKIQAAVAAPIANDPGFKTRVFAWMAAIIAAILLGAIWELAATSTNLRYTGPRFW